MRHPQPRFSPSFQPLNHMFLISRQIDRHRKSTSAACQRRMPCLKSGCCLSSPLMASYVCDQELRSLPCGVDESRPVDRVCICAGRRMCVYVSVCAKTPKVERMEGCVRPAIHVVRVVIYVSQLFGVSAAFHSSLQTFSRKRASDRELARQGSQLSPENHTLRFSLTATENGLGHSLTYSRLDASTG